MCVPVLIAGASVVSGVAAIAGYRQQQSALRAMEQNALVSSQFQSRMYNLQSSMLTAQSGLFAESASAFARQSGMFMEQSEWARRLGMIQSAHEFARARQAENDAERDSLVAAEQRRQKIGSGVVAFAANNVAVDASSAVQLWEQDEVADLAFEMENITEARDNEVYGYVWSGHTAAIQGLFEAQSYAIQAQGSLINAAAQSAHAANAAGEAGIATMQASNALLAGEAAAAQYRSQRRQNTWNLVGSLAGMGTDLGLMAAGGVFKTGKDA